MDDFGIPVRVFQRLAHLNHPVPDLVGLERAERLLQALVRERVPVDIFHRDRGPHGILDEIVDAHDIRVGQLPALACLSLEFIDRRAVEADGFREKFQGGGLLEPLVARQPNDPHPTAPQHALQTESLEHDLPGNKRSACPLAGQRIACVVHRDPQISLTL